jgi:hypothetical protein
MQLYGFSFDFMKTVPLVVSPAVRWRESLAPETTKPAGSLLRRASFYSIRWLML